MHSPVCIFLSWYSFQFEKPGRREDFTYPAMAKEAVGKALEDAKLSYDKVEQATVGYVYGECCHSHTLLLLLTH